MEKMSLDTLEMGNLFWGHSRGNYAIDRDKWQDIFSEFLDECGFGYSGYPEADNLKQYIKVEEYTEPHFYETCLAYEYLCENGTLISRDDENCEEYFSLNGKKYLASTTANDEFQKAWDDWYKETCNYDPDCVPAELEAAEPSESDFGTVTTVYEVTETPCESHYFDNGTFLIRPYFWGESEDMFTKPNFVYRPNDVVINWYKYPLRDSYINKEITDEEFRDMIAKCRESLGDGK